jgi:hypothetical protein
MSGFVLTRHPSRSDLSGHLIHFTKGVDGKNAFEVLIRILQEKRLLGSTGFVKGGIPCVSFTETPVDILAAGLDHAKGTERYSAFGLRFAKTHIFAAGGRPVIYQPDAEYAFLPPELQWRHVRFDPQSEPPVDWTWEREWRLAGEGLNFSEREVEVVVPDQAAADQLRKRIEADSYQEAWTVVLGDLAWGYHQPTPWQIIKARRADPGR